MKNGLTRSELSKKANCPFYVIDYLRNKNVLRIVKKGERGIPTLYHIDSIKTIKKHLR